MPKKPILGFLDLNLHRVQEYKLLNKDGKWEKKTRRRRKELQALLELLLKECGKPCDKMIPSCVVCEVYLAFARIDQFFED